MKQNKPASQVLQYQQSFSGPVPPPEILEKYNRIVPNAAERILSMAEKQGEHRQFLEKVVIKSDSRNSLLGLIFGLIVGLAGMGCGVFCIINGHQIGGGILGGTTIVGLVSAFIYGSRSRKQERITKHQNS
jgi:uncharacterized membrane protein